VEGSAPSYDHLRKTMVKAARRRYKLAPLYHAIAHGCRAGRYKEALQDLQRPNCCQFA
jgi:hypothetical protein